MRHAVQRLTTQAERVTALVLGAVIPGRSFDDMLRNLERASVRNWRLLVGGTLGGLFALAMLAAWLGPIGLAVYFAAVFFLLR